MILNYNEARKVTPSVEGLISKNKLSNYLSRDKCIKSFVIYLICYFYPIPLIGTFFNRDSRLYFFNRFIRPIKPIT